ncbi:MAG: FAD-dependent oxidoreductase, partial [Alsobacter sp.]
RQLSRHRRFQSALWSLFAASPSPHGGEGRDMLVCRCEAVSLSTLRTTIATHAVSDVATLKRLTRAGMGRCQGRYCAPVLRALVGAPQTEAALPAPQMPVRPVALSALAVQKPEWGGHRRVMLPDRVLSPGPPLPVREAATVVIGAGIAGLSTALFLAREGHDVVVLDRGPVNAGASGGNAGSLHAQLLSFDHGARAEAGGGPAARTLPLQRDSIALWQSLEAELELDFELAITGGLMVAETERDLAFLAAKTAVERAQGIDCDIIGHNDLRRLEPALDPRFVGAAFCPQEGKINPLVATEGIHRAALAAGARVITGVEVRSIARGTSGFSLATNRGEIRAGRVVNAAGAFASRIGTMLGVDVPVHGAPLQMIVTEPAEPLISRLVAHADRHLTLKQAGNGAFIIGGGWTASLDPVRQHPRPLRDSIEGNLWVAQHVVPGLRKLHVLRSWAAMNINIDGAPILGEHPGLPGFFTCVTSNGYTLGPIMGRTTAAIILHGDAGRDLTPFSIARFD